MFNEFDCDEGVMGISEGGNIAKPTNEGIYQEEDWGFRV